MIEYKKNIKLLYIIYFFSSMVFHRGIFVLYLLDCGINNKQVGWLQLAFFWSNFLFEIPTGILGDKIGRKWSVFVSLVLLLINAIGMISFKHFYFFFVLFILEGIAFAFRSGANVALLYDSLRFIGKEGEYIKHISRISTISSIVLGISMTAGGYIKTFSWNYVYLMYAFSVFIAAFFCYQLYENADDYKEDESLTEKIQENSSYIRDLFNKTTKPIVIFLKEAEGKLFISFIIAYGVYSMAMTPAFVQGQSLFKFYQVSPEKIAMIFGIVQICSGAMYALSNKISNLLQFKYLIAITLILSSFCMFVHEFKVLYISLFSFFIISVFPSVTDILVDSYIQEKIPSHIRASLLSTKSFIESFLVGIGYFLFGYLLDKVQVTRVYLIISILPIISLFLFEYYFFKRKHHVRVK